MDEKRADEKKSSSLSVHTTTTLLVRTTLDLSFESCRSKENERNEKVSHRFIINSVLY
jgi:hypothetical protein